jgi:hypothetical protein
MLELCDDRIVRARTVVIATGARYRRPAQCETLMTRQGFRGNRARCFVSAADQHPRGVRHRRRASRSVKRVGGAIGEGAEVVAQIHAYLPPR